MSQFYVESQTDAGEKCFKREICGVLIGDTVCTKLPKDGKCSLHSTGAYFKLDQDSSVDKLDFSGIQPDVIEFDNDSVFICIFPCKACNKKFPYKRPFCKSCFFKISSEIRLEKRSNDNNKQYEKRSNDVDNNSSESGIPRKRLKGIMDIQDDGMVKFTENAIDVENNNDDIDNNLKTFIREQLALSVQKIQSHIDSKVTPIRTSVNTINEFNQGINTQIIDLGGRLDRFGSASYKANRNTEKTLSRLETDIRAIHEQTTTDRNRDQLIPEQPRADGLNQQQIGELTSIASQSLNQVTEINRKINTNFSDAPDNRGLFLITLEQMKNTIDRMGIQIEYSNRKISALESAVRDGMTNRK